MKIRNAVRAVAVFSVFAVGQAQFIQPIWGCGGSATSGCKSGQTQTETPHEQTWGEWASDWATLLFG